MYCWSLSDRVSSSILLESNRGINRTVIGEIRLCWDTCRILANDRNVLDIPGWIGSFTEDGVFNNVTAEESYRGEHLRDVVIAFGQMFPDVHRELHRVNVMGDVVAIELSIQGTFRGPMETPAGVIQPTGAKVNIPCADFFYMRNGKIERFDCYPALNIMLKQMGVPPDFASAVKRSTQR